MRMEDWADSSRAERLTKALVHFYRNGWRTTTQQYAYRYNVNVRSAQRDMALLADLVPGFKRDEKDGTWGITSWKRDS